MMPVAPCLWPPASTAESPACTVALNAMLMTYSVVCVCLCPDFKQLQNWALSPLS